MEDDRRELATLKSSVASIQILGSDSMNRGEKLEVVREALHQILEERKRKDKTDHDEDDDGREFLSKLLIQLDFLEEDARRRRPEEPAGREDVPETPKHDGQLCGRKEVDMGEVAKEIRRVKMQNVITHCLLSVMIVLTAAWQCSQVSFLLTAKQKMSKARQRMSDPLGTIGDAIKGYLKGKGEKPKIEAAAALPPIPVPGLPHVGLPSLSLDGEE